MSGGPRDKIYQSSREEGGSPPPLRPIAVGAVLAFAVEVQTEGANLDTIGVILMVVGFIGLLASLLFWNDGAPLRRRDTYGRRDREVVRERDYV